MLFPIFSLNWQTTSISFFSLQFILIHSGYAKLVRNISEHCLVAINTGKINFFMSFLSLVRQENLSGLILEPMKVWHDSAINCGELYP